MQFIKAHDMYSCLNLNLNANPSAVHLTHCSGNGQVEGSGDFDVLAIAGNKGDGVSETFHHGGIVGEEVGVGLLIGLAEEMSGEHLRGLNKAVVTAGHCDGFSRENLT